MLSTQHELPAGDDKRFGTLEQSTVCKPNPMQRDNGDFLTCGYLIIQTLSNPGQSDTPNSGTN